VRIALNLKGLPYEAIPVHLVNNGGEQHSADYQAINPQSLVPTLQTDDKTIAQSLAIIEYLDELHPTPPLLPNDHYLKAKVRAFALAIAADMHPLNNLRVLNYLSNELQISEAQKTAWYQHWIAKGFQSLENMLINTQQTGDFCFGNTPTLADVCLVPQMYNARRYACDLRAYPTLVRIDAHCQTQAAFQDAAPLEAPN
jgi:maleylpyruvate isomerase